jgi:hypothetical protein
MSIGKIREIGKETRAQDLLDLVRGERILLKGVGTDTQEEGVVVWRSITGEDEKYLVASRADIKKGSDPKFSINCQLYIRQPFETIQFLTRRLLVKDLAFPYNSVNCNSEGGMRRWITREIYPGHHLSFENTTYTQYNKLLENVDL